MIDLPLRPASGSDPALGDQLLQRGGRDERPEPGQRLAAVRDDHVLAVLRALEEGTEVLAQLPDSHVRGHEPSVRKSAEELSAWD